LLLPSFRAILIQNLFFVLGITMGLLFNNIGNILKQKKNIINALKSAIIPLKKIIIIVHFTKI
ncbi:MAG: hypothetical protein ACR2LL_11690, partial [Nitrosopumilus sp.]